MEFILEFLSVYLDYCRDLWLVLALGFFISGLFFKLIPTGIVERHFGRKGFKPIFILSLLGAALPVCCIGTLPIAVTLHRKGASLGAILAFMVATPATSLSALIICWKLFGLTFTVFIFCTIILMAFFVGVAINGLKVSPQAKENSRQRETCCEHIPQGGLAPSSTVGHKIKDAAVYAFITLPKEIGPEILIGIAIASFLTVFEPAQHFIRGYLTGLAGYFFIIVFGLATYVCSTASVPMADAFVHSGLSYGQALCYLLVGPITSYGTILVINKDFGGRVLSVYLAVICVFSLVGGMIYDFLVY